MFLQQKDETILKILMFLTADFYHFLKKDLAKNQFCFFAGHIFSIGRNDRNQALCEPQLAQNNVLVLT